MVRILAKNGGQSEIPKLKNRFFENETLNQKSETVNRKLCPWSIQNSLGDGRDHKLAMPPHFETTPQNVVFRGSGRVWPARFGKNRFSDRIFDFPEIFSMDVIWSKCTLKVLGGS